ncbi:MAG: hypothetical protein mread185_000070 [Mycoplasmataceae bacterium]|nr:MAG: hypothetical protein mread185_000070 [Mycoplasmataceae bacterium]
MDVAFSSNKVPKRKRDKEFFALWSKKKKTIKCEFCQKSLDFLGNNYIDKTDPLYFRLYGWTKEYHKTCWAKIEAENERIRQKCAKKQAERIANFTMREDQRQQMDAEEDTLDLEEYSYPHESQTQLIDWEEYQIQQKEKNKNLTTLVIEPNKYRFKDWKLVINKKDFPNLKTLYACGLGLEEVELDHDGLENLHLTNNELADINLDNTPNLKDLFLSNNSIQSINVSHLKNLEDFRINKNFLYYSGLDVSGLANLWNLDCSETSLRELTLGDNPNLIILDADLNGIKNLDFPHLPQLAMLSLRNNSWKRGVKTSLILRSPNLFFLDYHKSDVKELVFDSEYPLKNSNQLIICDDESYTNPDDSWNPNAFTEWENLFFQIYSKRKAKKQGLPQINLQDDETYFSNPDNQKGERKKNHWSFYIKN